MYKLLGGEKIEERTYFKHLLVISMPNLPIRQFHIDILCN